MFAFFYNVSEAKLRPRRGSQINLNQNGIGGGYKGSNWGVNGGYNWQNRGWGIGVTFGKRNQILAPYSDQNKTVSENGRVYKMSNLVPSMTLACGVSLHIWSNHLRTSKP